MPPVQWVMTCPFGMLPAAGWLLADSCSRIKANNLAYIQHHPTLDEQLSDITGSSSSILIFPHLLPDGPHDTRIRPPPGKKSPLGGSTSGGDPAASDASG